MISGSLFFFFFFPVLCRSDLGVRICSITIIWHLRKSDYISLTYITLPSLFCKVIIHFIRGLSRLPHMNRKVQDSTDKNWAMNSH